MAETWDDPTSGREFNKGELLQLYKVYQDRQICDLDQHFRFANYYVAILVALQTGLLVGLVHASDKPIAAAFVGIPLMSILLAHQGRLTTLRFYRRYTEGRVRLTKIEHLLGLHGPIRLACVPLLEHQSGKLWAQDNGFLPERYVREAHQRTSSGQFIRKRTIGYGVGLIVQRTLRIFEGISWLTLVCLPLWLCRLEHTSGTKIACLAAAELSIGVAAVSYVCYRFARHHIVEEALPRDGSD